MPSRQEQCDKLRKLLDSNTGRLPEIDKIISEAENSIKLFKTDFPNLWQVPALGDVMAKIEEDVPAYLHTVRGFKEEMESRKQQHEALCSGGEAAMDETMSMEEVEKMTGIVSGIAELRKKEESAEKEIRTILQDSEKVLREVLEKVRQGNANQMSEKEEL